MSVRRRPPAFRQAAGAVLFLWIAASAPGRAQEPVIAWTAGNELRVEAGDVRLARLGGNSFSLRLRLRVPALPENASILKWQAPDQKSGFRLFTRKPHSTPELSFEAAFDWKDRRNNRPLQLTVPVSAIRGDAPREIIVRFHGPKLELFVNGVLLDEEWPVGAMAHAAGEALLIGEAAQRAIEELLLWNRALTDEEISVLGGGTDKVAQCEREFLGPERPVTPYWKPRGFNTGVGDCMPFFRDGRFHLFYLIDRRGHGSKWGLGAHQWAHLSTADLLQWTHHPLAIPITDPKEGSICTGSAFEHDGVVHAFYAVRTADGSPARLAASRSKDGVHFEKAAWSTTLTAPYQGPPARDPVVFQDSATKLFHMLVTTELLQPRVARRGGCLADLVSRDLQAWEQQEPFIVPGFADQPECPDWFAWNGWYYLIFSNNGVARYRLARQPLGPWLTPKVDAFDGPQARVLKTAAFHGGRRIGAAFLAYGGSGYGGQLVLREIIQHADGTLGTKFPNELRPALLPPAALTLDPLTDGVAGAPSRVRIDAISGLGVAALDRLPVNFRLKLRVHPETKTGAFGLCVRGSGHYEKGHELRFEPGREKAGWRNADAGTTDEHERSAIYAVEGLDRPFEVEVIVTEDIFDVCIGGVRTLIARAAPAFTGDRLFLFAQDSTVTFQDIEVQPLATPR